MGLALIGMGLLRPGLTIGAHKSQVRARLAEAVEELLRQLVDPRFVLTDRTAA